MQVGAGPTQMEAQPHPRQNSVSLFPHPADNLNTARYAPDAMDVTCAAPALQLPACQRCRLRKVRCDRSAPKCASCSKGNVSCIIVDPETGEQYARDYLRRLEEQEKALKAQLGERTMRFENSTPGVSTESSNRVEGPATASTAALQSYFVGDGSGLEFLHSILSDAQWQEHRIPIMHQLAARPRMQKQHVQPNPMPPIHEAEALVENYFSRFHIHHTFLLRHEVLSMFRRLYSPMAEDDPVTVQDRFRLLMIFAISATTRHRAGLCSENPYGYFKAAENYLRGIPLIKDLDAIQNLLLIARFGMYHHIGTSLWEISQLCMRQCIEWRLHMPRLKTPSPLREQHHRRIFWECYILDRYSSGILGRPFAIQEKDISVDLPIDVDDEALINSTASTLDEVPPNTSSHPTELSIFIHCIKLRRISSRIHTKFYIGQDPVDRSNKLKRQGQPSRFPSVGHVYTYFSRLRLELKNWRATAPIYPDPKSLYERPEWHDFLHEKDSMLLARGALHNVPHRSLLSTGILKDLLTACYTSAKNIIELYANLLENRAITWTRSYFQVIFTAGLSLIYCLNFDVFKTDMHESQARQSLDICRKILQFFKENMPDAGSFTLVFELLSRECFKNRISHAGVEDRTTSAVPVGSLLQSEIPTNSVPPDADFGSLNNSAALIESQFNAYTDPQVYDGNFRDQIVGFTDDFSFMTQLEAGLGEYAWGCLPMNEDFSNQLLLQ